MLFLYRSAQGDRETKPSLIRRCLGLDYKIDCALVVGADLPILTSVGPRLVMHHGIGIVVTSHAVLGSDVVIRQNTTIGAKAGASKAGAPTIGDGVDIGANCVVIGKISVGNGAVLGAGSVVVADVRPGEVVAGNPARVLTTRKQDSE